MVDQGGSGTVAGVHAGPGDPASVTVTGHTGEPFHGRPVSWVAVSIIVVGFIAGGLGLVFGPSWPVFWTGGGLVVLGGLLGLATGILNDWY
jgi:hypothetical protein